MYLILENKSLIIVTVKGEFIWFHCWNLMVKRTDWDIFSVWIKVGVTKKTLFVVFKSHMVFDHMTSDTFSLDIFFIFDPVCIRLCTERTELCHRIPISLIWEQSRYFFFFRKWNKGGLEINLMYPCGWVNFSCLIDLDRNLLYVCSILKSLYQYTWGLFILCNVFSWSYNYSRTYVFYWLRAQQTRYILV